MLSEAGHGVFSYSKIPSTLGDAPYLCRTCLSSGVLMVSRLFRKGKIPIIYLKVPILRAKVEFKPPMKATLPATNHYWVKRNFIMKGRRLVQQTIPSR